VAAIALAVALLIGEGAPGCRSRVGAWAAWRSGWAYPGGGSRIRPAHLGTGPTAFPLPRPGATALEATLEGAGPARSEPLEGIACCSRSWWSGMGVGPADLEVLEGPENPNPRLAGAGG